MWQPGDQEPATTGGDGTVVDPQAEAESGPTQSRRGSGHILLPRWTLLAVPALAAVLVVLIMVLALRSGNASTPLAAVPSPSATPTATFGVEPTPSTLPTANPASREQQEHYRTYVSTVAIDGAGLLAAMIQLRSCGGNRDACRHALQDASDLVAKFQTDLDRTNVPACLTDVDGQLHGALGFYERGFALAREGGNVRDQLKVIQGTLLVAVGTWRLGVALRQARRSEC
jgi:hypothetical protein